MLKNILTICVWMLVALPMVSLAQDNNCMTCHQENEEEDGASHKIVRDVHYQNGLLCNDCHGGDPTLDDMDDVRDSRGYRGVPDYKDVPAFCARCHSDAAYMHEHNPSLPTDQLAKYKTSVHGQLLLEKGDTKVANCISCHTVHEIGDAKLPHSSTYPLNLPATCGKCHGDADYMSGYGIPIDQLDKYKQSVHGIALLEKHDLGAPACNDCHGNHGAAPPGVSSLAAVCGNCHAFQAELFNASPHKKAFTDNDFPMCEACHSNHLIVQPLDAMVGDAEPAICTECHATDDGTIGLATAASINAGIKKLVRAHNEAEFVLAEAIEKGMLTTDEEFLLKEVKQELIQARTLVHSFDSNRVVEKTKVGLNKADSVRTSSAALIDEYYFRRKGLGVATLFITIVCVALWIRIKRL